MSTNPFHIDNLDPIGKSASRILKGGPGSGRHTQGSAQDTATRLAQFVSENRRNISPYKAKDIAQAHVDHAGYHNKMAKYLHEQANAVALNGMGNVALAKQMEKEAQLHDKASSAHLAASETVLKAQGEWGGRLGLDEKKPTASQVSAASNAAAKATVAASGPQTTAALGWQTPDIQLPSGAPYFLAKGGPGSGRHPEGATSVNTHEDIIPFNMAKTIDDEGTDLSLAQDEAERYDGYSGAHADLAEAFAADGNTPAAEAHMAASKAWADAAKAAKDYWDDEADEYGAVEDASARAYDLSETAEEVSGRGDLPSAYYDEDLASAGNPRDYTIAATNPDGTHTVIAQVTHERLGY